MSANSYNPNISLKMEIKKNIKILPQELMVIQGTIKSNDLKAKAWFKIELKAKAWCNIFLKEGSNKFMSCPNIQFQNCYMLCCIIYKKNSKNCRSTKLSYLIIHILLNKMKVITPNPHIVLSLPEAI